MGYTSVFRRYEIKYLISRCAADEIIAGISEYTRPDSYGASRVRSLYFDTDTLLLARRSAERPRYKEKLRLRCYGYASPEDCVFAELKKKYDGVVYKRRVSLREREAMAWLSGYAEAPTNTQISREIDFCLSRYEALAPRVLVEYERAAYYAVRESDFRVTLDRNILASREELSLCRGGGGVPLIGEDMVLMELKCGGGIPLWMTRLLSEMRIYKTSFSKYVTAARLLFFNEKRENFYLRKDI